MFLFVLWLIFLSLYVTIELEQSITSKLGYLVYFYSTGVFFILFRNSRFMYSLSLLSLNEDNNLFFFFLGFCLKYLSLYGLYFGLE